MTKYFNVVAETSLPVLSDGTIDTSDTDRTADAYIRKYVVSECGEDGLITEVKEYEPKDFDKIAEEHQPPEWQNFSW